MGTSNKFSQTWKTQTDLAKEFGVSSIQLGKHLKNLGYRTADGLPSDESLSGGLVRQVSTKDGVAFYMWNREAIIPLLEQTLPRLTEQDFWLNEVLNRHKSLLKEANERVQRFDYECIFDDVPKKHIQYIKVRMTQLIGETW